jgi:hypothetical protein
MSCNNVMKTASFTFYVTCLHDQNAPIVHTSIPYHNRLDNDDHISIAPVALYETLMFQWRVRKPSSDISHFCFWWLPSHKSWDNTIFGPTAEIVQWQALHVFNKWSNKLIENNEEYKENKQSRPYSVSLFSHRTCFSVLGTSIKEEPYAIHDPSWLQSHSVNEISTHWHQLNNYLVKFPPFGENQRFSEDDVIKLSIISCLDAGSLGWLRQSMICSSNAWQTLWSDGTLWTCQCIQFAR